MSCPELGIHVACSCMQPFCFKLSQIKSVLNLQKVLDSRILSLQHTLCLRHCRPFFAFDVGRPAAGKQKMRVWKLVFLFPLAVCASNIVPCGPMQIEYCRNQKMIFPALYHSNRPSADSARERDCLSVANVPLRLKGGSSTNSNFEEVGSAFVLHYYNIFDTNRAGLQNLYQDVSMMTFEGEKIQGSQAIAQKLTSLPFQSVKHEVITVDSQPMASGGVLVFVCGNLKVIDFEPGIAC